MRCVVVGPVAHYQTRTAALHQVAVLRANVNREVINPKTPIIISFKSLAGHYRTTEIRMDNHDKKAYSTKRRNQSCLDKWILPLGRLSPW